MKSLLELASSASGVGAHVGVSLACAIWAISARTTDSACTIVKIILVGADVL